MLASDRVLGPRWSQKELRTFYILLKAYGKQWERLEERLPSRTNAMIRALFEMHRGYLSLQEASVEGFCTIMTDHYKSLDELQPPTSGGGGGGVALPMEDKTEPPAAVGTTSMTMQNLISELATTTMASDVAPPPSSSLPAANSISLAAVEASTLTTPPPPAAKAKEEGVLSDTRSKKKRKLDKFLAREDQLMSDDADSATTTTTTTTCATSHDEELSNAAGAELVPSPVDHADQERPLKRRARTRKPMATTTTTHSSSHLHDHEQGQGQQNGNTSKGAQLPWFYWFCSFVDMDFFAHNEFVECLQRMQLGNLTKAARPIWSSVRASMGHPRRLSARFLVEEKHKLEQFRSIQLVNDAAAQSSQWPYKTRTPLANGLRVLAQLSNPRRFVAGTIENFSLGDGVCKVRLDDNGSRVCSLDAVMLITEAKHGPPHQSGQGGKPVGGGSNTTTRVRPTPLFTAPDGRSVLNPTTNRLLLDQFQKDKLTAVALVRDLLKRKELLVNAMAKMNAQARIMSHFTSNNWVASHTTTSDEAAFQRQYAWLVVNLDVTNRYLRAALLRLQDASHAPLQAADSKSGSESSSSSSNMAPRPHGASSSHPQAPPPYEENGSATLTLEHMRWAVNFLALSRKKSAELVTEMAATSTMPGTAAAESNSGSEQPSTATEDDQQQQQQQQQHQQLPLQPSTAETNELIANCLSLASVFRRGSSANIPPLITQKLMERMFELLEPQFESNMDLYAELRAAAEGFRVMQQQQRQ